MAATSGEIDGESAITEPWQAYMKYILEPDSDEIDEESPAQAAVQRLLNLYRDSYRREEFGFYRADDMGARGYLDSISIHVVELANHFKWDSASHQRLVDTMIALREGCAKVFNEDDPQLVYTSDGVLMKVDGAWNACSMTTPDNLNRCHICVNVTALFAKLFGAGLFDGDLKYAQLDLKESFETSSGSEAEQSPRQRALEAVAALWLIFGGSLLAEVTKENDSGASKKQFPHIFNRQNWKSWAERLAQIARDAPDNVEFDLKRLASKAHHRMLELYPEALEQDE